ncbi:ethanolamine ammonia-lyase subunit EutC [Acidicapsa acidisoli]|uniref:ethanolamine ammonia-lyase subunit EutC n=1 Tax=Acidicapsa acidisoli TaxID=1615681 RepID=UPI0021E0B9A8|nr:ethanolamine ammonia-lyase subunit EutC [Acidicapsa acidisoli]
MTETAPVNPLLPLLPSDLPISDSLISDHLRSLTPARVALRKSGTSIATTELLDFQLAHARARDAVHAQLQPASLLAELRTLLNPIQGPREVLLLHSGAPDRQTYLQRPDLGRKLDTGSLQRLQNYPRSSLNFDLSIVIADGLSALAVERHVILLLAALLPALHQTTPEMQLAPICIVEQGRVAVADEVAQTLSAALVVILIGERPGLSSPDSLGAYITWQPQPGRTTDADRNCISNIREEGLPYPQAAARLLHYIDQARARQLSGVALKDPDIRPALEDTA